MTNLTLTGLDGSNPLGFMASLGVFSVAAQHHADCRLGWEFAGIWRPILLSSANNIDELVEWLAEDRQSCAADPALALRYAEKHDLKAPPEHFREYLRLIAESSGPTSRRSADWAGAFGSDVIGDNNGNTKPTALHFTAGQQQFLQMVTQLVEEVTVEDLREAIVGPWSYARPLPVMGWDSTASRDYALRARNPSTDKKLGVPGADWLAIRALSFFPVAPIDQRLATVCCFGRWKDGDFRWPLWVRPVSKDTASSILLSRPDRMVAAERVARGIGAVFSCGIRRSDQGGYGSFEPAKVI